MLDSQCKQRLKFRGAEDIQITSKSSEEEINVLTEYILNQE